MIKDDDFLKNNNDIWNKDSKSIKKKLDCEPIYNQEFMKIKIRSYSVEVTDFHTRIMPEWGSNYICCLIVLIDSVLKKD